MPFELDKNGFPVLLAEVPNAGVSSIDRNAKSGNPRHDKASGKFGSGGGEGKPVPQSNVDPLEFARMLDAARDAARQFDNPQAEELQKYLKGKAKNPEAVDINAFLTLVLEWKKNDLVDLLDSQLRTAGQKVKLGASRNFIKASLGGLDENAQAEVLHRLEARGHSRKALDKVFGRKVDEPEKATKKRDQLAASLQFSAELVTLFEVDRKQATDVIELTTKIAEVALSRVPAPVINVAAPDVHVTVPEQKPGRKVVRRDDRGFITEVVDAEES